MSDFSFSRMTRRQLLGTSAAVAAAGLLPTSSRAFAQDFSGRTITVGTIDGELSNGVEAQKAAFEAATGAKLELVKIAGAEFQTKITADLASGVGAFDVVIEPFIFLHSQVAGGFIEPLDSYIANDATIGLDDFIPLLFNNMGRYNEQICGLPYKADAYVFFYRKDLFEDPAVQAAYLANTGSELTVPTTSEEAVATAKFFTRSLNPDSPTEFGWAHMAEATTSANWIWASRFGALGGTYLDENFHPSFNNEAGIAAMQTAVELNSCCPPDVASYAWEESNTAFLTGRVAMMEQWPGLSKMAETEEGFWGRSEVIGKVGYGVPPGVTVDGQVVQSSVLGGWAAAISSLSDEKELAYVTAAWLTSSEGELLKIAAGNDPSRFSTYQAAGVAEANPLYPTLLSCLENARITADVDAPPVGFELQTVMGETFNKVWSGDLEGAQALADVEASWTEILQMANLYK